MEAEPQERVSVSNFSGKEGKLWLTFLILSPVFAAAFAAFAVIYADDGLLTVIGCCGIAAVCLFLFGVCIATARRRTSRWTADAEGVCFFALGRQVAFLRWEEMREAGFLRLEGEKRAERLRLYWSSEELRGAVKGGKFAGREVGLGANRRGACILVYPVPAYYGEKGGIWYPADDPLILFTRTHFRRPLRHEEFLSGHSD